MDNFMEYMGKNYTSIKKQLQQYKNFDEDVFHNTIIRCNEIADENVLKFRSPNDMYRYFIGAYKTNLLREKMYYYQKNVTHPDEMTDNGAETGADAAVDITIINDDIRLTFGERLQQAYMRYVTENTSIAKLQKELGIKNLKQRFHDIKDYIF